MLLAHITLYAMQCISKEAICFGHWLEPLFVVPDAHKETGNCTCGAAPTFGNLEIAHINLPLFSCMVLVALLLS